jgi:hypothetical protein
MSEPNATVASAISTAASLTGVSARYLTATAARESAFDPEAQAGTSSAAGLYQFIESTWLETLSRNAGRLGLEREAGLAREDALALRFDPQLSALLAGALTAENSDLLAARLGRPPTEGELYSAHVLGAGGAAQLARAAQKSPEASVAQLFPAAARANHALFHDDAGRPLGAAALSAKFASMIDGVGGHDAAPVANPAPVMKAQAPASPSWSDAGRTVALRGVRAPLRLHPDTVEILAALRPPERAGRSDDT